MRIGIDCRTILDPATGESAGVGHYTFYLTDALVRHYPRDEFVLFGDKRVVGLAAMREWARQKNVRVVELPWADYKKYLPVGYAHVIVPKVIERQKLDVFHSLAYILPLTFVGNGVVTVHDLAIYEHPEWFPARQGFSKKISMPWALRRAKKIIAVSQATARSLQQLFNIPAAKISVIYEGAIRSPRLSAAERERILRRLGVNAKFLLFIGTIEPRKNLVRLIKAFDNYLDQQFPRGRDLQLVIAGKKGWKYQEVFQVVAAAQWSANVRVIGYVSARDKAALLQSCLFFVFPSLWEGFGLPVLEAVSNGVAVLTANSSSLPEVGGAGALYVNPNSISAIAQGISVLARSSSKRRVLARHGKEHARNFTWQKCARQTYEVYKNIVQ